jgi:hypothetical protein
LPVLSRQIPSATRTSAANELPTVLEVLLTVIGTAAIVAAVAQFRSFVSTLSAQDLPPRIAPRLR